MKWCYSCGRVETRAVAETGDVTLTSGSARLFLLRTFSGQHMSTLAPKADMCGAVADVRYGPIADSCSAANTGKAKPADRVRKY